MEVSSRKLAGPDAINCGRVKIRKDPKVATDCALGAFKENKPFRVRYDLHGIDSAVSEGLLRASDGKLYATSFDGDPMGGGGISQERQRFTSLLCPQPFAVRVRENGRLSCAPPSSRRKKPTFPVY